MLLGMETWCLVPYLHILNILCDGQQGYVLYALSWLCINSLCLLHHKILVSSILYQVAIERLLLSGLKKLVT